MKKPKTIILFLLVFLLPGVVSAEGTDLARYPHCGDSGGLKEIVTVPTLQNPGLAGFYFDFEGRREDHEIERIQARASTNKIEVEYSETLPDISGYHWCVNRQGLPLGTTFHHVEGSVKIGGISQRLGMPGEFPGVPVLTGFHIYADMERNLEEIEVQVRRDQFDQLNLQIVFKDDDWSGDVFSYRVDYAVVPADKVFRKCPFEGKSKGSDRKVLDAKHPVLQGFQLKFENGDHEMDAIGVMLEPPASGGYLFVDYNDRNDDDEFSWKVWWVDVSMEAVDAVHDRYVKRGGRDVTPPGSMNPNQPNDCTDPSHPCRTINHAVTQSESGDTIKVAIGELTENVNIEPSSPTNLKIEGGWNDDFTQRSIDINGFLFTMLRNGRFDIVADRINLDVTISGFIMKGGDQRDGGAIKVSSLNGGTATININNNKINGNKAERYGGGIYAYNSASTLRLDVSNNLITDNASGRAGGGILVDSWDSGQSTVNLTNNIIADNTATRYGGGAFFNSESGSIKASLINNTITSNSAGSNGGGFVSRSTGITGGSLYVDVKNSIMWGNTASEDVFISGDATTPSTVVNASYSDLGDVHVTGGTFNDIAENINKDPFFVDSSNGDYHLDMGSPAIDSGIAEERVCDPQAVICDHKRIAPYVDFEGERRGNFVDMGADEFISAPPSNDNNTLLIWLLGAIGSIIAVIALAI